MGPKFRSARACLVICLLVTTLAGCDATVTADRVTAPPTNPSPTPNLISNVVSAGANQNNAETTTATGVIPTETPASDQSTAVPTLSVASTSTASAAVAVPIDQLPKEISQMIAQVPAHVGMVVALGDGTKLFEAEPDTLFESASLYKLAIMVEVYRESEAGELTFDDLVTLYPGFFLEDDSVYGYDLNAYDQVPVGTLLSNMITLSSNVAATALLYLVGTDQVNQTAADLGLENTRILWSPSAFVAPDSGRGLPTVRTHPTTRLLSMHAGAGSAAGATSTAIEGAYNVTTPGDMALLFEELLNGKVVSTSASAEMLDLLSQQEINDRLPALLPNGTRVAHKTGDLDNSVHDAGIVFAPARPVVVVVLSDDIENRQSVVDLIQNVAQLIYVEESH